MQTVHAELYPAKYESERRTWVNHSHVMIGMDEARPRTVFQLQAFPVDTPGGALLGARHG